MFSTGTDEHGLKVKQAAEAQQRTPLAFSDEVSSSFKVSLCYVCIVCSCSILIFSFFQQRKPPHARWYGGVGLSFR